jgi:hypothetical protein
MTQIISQEYGSLDQYNENLCKSNIYSSMIENDIEI